MFYKWRLSQNSLFIFHPSNLSGIISEKETTLWGKGTILAHFSFTKNCLLIVTYHIKGIE